MIFFVSDNLVVFSHIAKYWAAAQYWVASIT